MSRIPSIARSKVDKVTTYADDTERWIDMDSSVDKQTAKKHTINHHGLEVRYSVAYKNDEDDNTVGELPIRCLTFHSKNGHEEKDLEDFIQRTLEIFGFSEPEEVKGNSGAVHYHEQLFQI